MGKTSRVVVYGLKGVGKTSMLEQAIYGNLTKDTFVASTIEDIYVANIETERGTKERIRFYDTAGGVPGIRPSILPADGYLLVFSPHSAESLDYIIEVKKEIDRSREKKEVVTVVVSLDMGRGTNTGVTRKGAAWAGRERLKLMEASPLYRASLYPGFVALASLLAPPQPKSSFPNLRKARPAD